MRLKLRKPSQRDVDGAFRINNTLVNSIIAKHEKGSPFYDHKTSQALHYKRQKDFYDYIHDPTVYPGVELYDESHNHHENVVPLKRSAQFIVFMGVNNLGTTNQFVNSKNGFLIRYPRHLLNATSQEVAKIFRPGAENADSSDFFDTTKFSVVGQVTTPGLPATATASRPVGVKVRIVYCGNPQASNGSLYLAFPSAHQGMAEAVLASTFAFNNFYGELDTVAPTVLAAVDTAGQNDAGISLHTITMAELVQKGVLEFTLLNALFGDQIFQAGDFAAGDNLNEVDGGNQSTARAVCVWSDSNSVTDKIRVETTFMYEIIQDAQQLAAQGVPPVRRSINATTPHPGYNHIRSVSNHTNIKNALSSSKDTLKKIQKAVDDAATQGMDWAKTGRKYGGPIGAGLAGAAGAADAIYNDITGSSVGTKTQRTGYRDPLPKPYTQRTKDVRTATNKMHQAANKIARAFKNYKSKKGK